MGVDEFLGQASIPLKVTFIVCVERKATKFKIIKNMYLGKNMYLQLETLWFGLLGSGFFSFVSNMDIWQILFGRTKIFMLRRAPSGFL